MTKPIELIHAELLDGWCRRYSALPWPGSVLQQPAAWWLRWQSTLAIARGPAPITASVRVDDDFPSELLALPMEALGG